MGIEGVEGERGDHGGGRFLGISRIWVISQAQRGQRTGVDRQGMCCSGIWGRFDGDGSAWLEFIFDNGQEMPLLGMKQAVGSNHLEAAREEVLKESAHELLGWEGGGPRAMGL